MEIKKVKKYQKLKLFLISFKKTPTIMVDTIVNIVEQTRIYLIRILTSLVVFIKDVSDAIAPLSKPIFTFSYGVFVAFLLVQNSYKSYNL